MSMIGATGTQAAEIKVEAPVGGAATPPEKFDPEQFIPQDLRDAMGELEKAGLVDEDEDEAPVTKKSSSKNSSEEEDEEDEWDADDEPDDEDGGNAPTTSKKAKNWTPDAIQKLISSEDADDDDDEEEEDDTATPPWQKSEKFKSFTKKATTRGLKEEEIVDLISEITDNRVLENTQIVKTITTERDTLKNLNENLLSENKRLKKVEAAAYFNNSPETQDKYLKPLQQAARDIHQVFKQAGEQIDIRQITGATSVKELMTAISHVSSFDDDDITKVKSLWKGFKHTEREYEAALNESQHDLKKHLSLEIPEPVQKDIFDSAFSDSLDDPSLKYLQTAVMDGLEKSPELIKAVGSMRANFNNLLQMIMNPQEIVHNKDSLTKLAKYVIKNIHHQKRSIDYDSVLSELEETKKARDLLVDAYKKLKKSARGITTPGGISSKTMQKTARSKGRDTEDEDLEELAKEYARKINPLAK